MTIEFQKKGKSYKGEVIHDYPRHYYVQVCDERTAGGKRIFTNTDELGCTEMVPKKEAVEIG